MVSNKICSIACVVVVTTRVLKNSGVPNSFKLILQIKKTTTNVSGVTFANVTKQGKSKTIKLGIPKSTVSSVSLQVPSLKDFLPPAGVRKKKYVPKEIVRIEDLSSKTGEVLVSGRAPVPIVPREVEPPTTGGKLKAVKEPHKPKKQNKKLGRFTLAWYKLYLDSCATYHMSLVTSLLQDVKEVVTELT